MLKPNKLSDILINLRNVLSTYHDFSTHQQTEANRQMYRSLMEQVARFLDRARKSLDIIHEKSSSKRNSNSHNNSGFQEKSRVPRSRSVHAVHAEHNGSPSRCTTASSSCASSTTSSASSASSTSSSSSRFSRAKSVAQISANTTSGLRDFTWSVLRKNDPANCTPTRTKPAPPPVSASVQDVNKTQESVVYRSPSSRNSIPTMCRQRNCLRKPLGLYIFIFNQTIISIN